MEIDHLFIFTNKPGAEADQLVDFGLTEGSSRAHPGQGTVNRKFYFENCFLEILWVQHEEEINSEPTRKVGLWDRSRYQVNGASPFGLCLVNTEDTDELFEDSMKYQPTYFPPGMAIEVLAHTDQPYLPWTFRLPYRGRKKTQEPTEHRNGIRQLTKVAFGIPESALNSSWVDTFAEESTIIFTPSEGYHLHVEFDHERQGKRHVFSELNLTITY